MTNAKGLTKFVIAGCAALVLSVLLAYPGILPNIPGLQASAGIQTAYANEYGDFTYEVVEGNARVTKYTGSATDLDIPTKMDGYTVTSIGEGAFMCLDKTTNTFTSVTIPKSVTLIGAAAFYGNSQLTNVTINGNKEIAVESGAFENCGLTEMTITKGMSFVNTWAAWSSNPFSGCPIQKFKVQGNGSYEAIDDGRLLVSKADSTVFAFAGGSVTGTYKVPAGIKAIGESAFEKASLAGVQIANDVKTIGENAFARCKSLKSVTIGKNVETIGAYAFIQCPKLNQVTIPASAKLKSIKDRAFFDCPKLKSIFIPASVKSIGYLALGMKSGIDKGIEEEPDDDYVPVKGFCLTVTKGSKAYKYAKANGLNYVGTTKVRKINAGKKSLTVTAKKALYSSASKKAYKYQFAYKVEGGKSWKTIKSKTTKVTIKKLKKGKRYLVKVRAIKKGKSTGTGYGVYSATKLSPAVK